MTDFTINFLSNTKFIFSDISNYISGELDSLIGEASLKIFLPTITEGVFHTINLDINGEGELLEQTIDTSLENPSFSMVDGVYRFELTYKPADWDTLSATKYFVKDTDLLICRRKLLRGIVNGTNGCQACEANYFSAALNSAKDEAAAGNYKQAELLVYKLIETCNDCP